MSKSFSTLFVDMNADPSSYPPSIIEESISPQITFDNKNISEKINEDDDLSEFKISEGGVLIDSSWSNTFNFHCKVLDVKEDNVILDCLIDESENLFEKRTFNKKLFSSVKNLKFGSLILVRCFDNYDLGESKIKIVEGSNYVNKYIFDSTDTINELKELSIFKAD